MLGSEALLIFRREQVSLFFQSVNDCRNLLIYWSCTIYVAKFVCCLPANDPEKKHTSPLINSTCLDWICSDGKVFSFRNNLGSIWIALRSPLIVFWVCMDWVLVCTDCVLEIVGPRPPLIQLSTDIRGSWIKGGVFDRVWPLALCPCWLYSIPPYLLCQVSLAPNCALWIVKMRRLPCCLLWVVGLSIVCDVFAIYMIDKQLFQNAMT